MTDDELKHILDDNRVPDPIPDLEPIDEFPDVADASAAQVGSAADDDDFDEDNGGSQR